MDVFCKLMSIFGSQEPAVVAVHCTAGVESGFVCKKILSSFLTFIDVFRENDWKLLYVFDDLKSKSTT